MAKLAITFGILLIILGVATFTVTGARFPTSLIPAGFGILLLLCGGLANTANVRRRMIAMHIAALIGLIGFLGTAKSLVDAARLFKGQLFPYPAAVEEKAAMALLSLIFVVLCVRSFVAARRARA